MAPPGCIISSSSSFSCSSSISVSSSSLLDLSWFFFSSPGCSLFSLASFLLSFLSFFHSHPSSAPPYLHPLILCHFPSIFIFPEFPILTLPGLHPLLSLLIVSSSSHFIPIIFILPQHPILTLPYLHPLLSLLILSSSSHFYPIISSLCIFYTLPPSSSTSHPHSSIPVFTSYLPILILPHPSSRYTHLSSSSFLTMTSPTFICVLYHLRIYTHLQHPLPPYPPLTFTDSSFLTYTSSHSPSRLHTFPTFINFYRLIPSHIHIFTHSQHPWPSHPPLTFNHSSFPT